METPGWMRALSLAGCLGMLVLGSCDDPARGALTGSAEDLLAALDAGDGKTALRLLEAGVVPAGRNRAGKTALILALEARNPGVVDALVESGASVETLDAEGGSALYHAVRTGELSGVKALLDRGANPNQEVPGGGSLVAYALEEGRTASAQLLFHSGATRRARGADGSPVSFVAARRGADWMLREILDQGAEVDSRDRQGDTLMHVAVRDGRRELLELLWGHGADTDAVNRDGQTPLHVALGTGRTEMVPALLKFGASAGLADRTGRLPVSMALAQGDDASLHALLRTLGKTDWAGADGRALVKMALDEREFASARMLVDAGAGLEGFLPGAVISGDDELFDFLMASGVDPNEGGKKPPLLDAVRLGNERMAQVLLEAGADPKVVGPEGQSVFHMAMARDLTESVRLLLERGADANEAFNYPARDDFVALVKSEGQIKWFLKKDRGVTPLMMAADRGNLALARVLLDHGAKTGVWTRKHRHWPINFASRRDDVKLMQLLLKRNPDEKSRTVKVDLSEQRAWVYDADGKVLLETAVSSGKKNYRTRTGEFVITNKYRSWSSTIYRGASMPYFQRLSCGDFGFHQGYCPGYAASHGCIRVPSGNAKKLYALTKPGDRVAIVD
jgi:ankyrin repeat protein